LGELHYCRTSNLVPIVCFGDNWPYWSADGYRGARNAWEYYFAPVSPLTLGEVFGRDEAYLTHCNIFDFDPARSVANQNPRHVYDLSRRGHVPVPSHVTVVNRWPAFDAGTRHVREDRRAIVRRLIDEFIRVHPAITASVETWAARHLAGRQVVGVHVRGGEHDDEIEGWHALAHAPLRLYFREVDAALDQRPEAGVLLATDTTRTLDAFRRRYGDRMLSYDARRSDGDGAPHVDFGGPLVGEEVLIEGLLLARTQFLVHGISNLSTVALCFAPTLPHVDVYDRHGPTLTRLLRLRRGLRSDVA
jgi:hypothetical protein